MNVIEYIIFISIRSLPVVFFGFSAVISSQNLFGILFSLIGIYLFLYLMLPYLALGKQAVDIWDDAQSELAEYFDKNKKILIMFGRIIYTFSIIIVIYAFTHTHTPMSTSFLRNPGSSGLGAMAVAILGVFVVFRPFKFAAFLSSRPQGLYWMFYGIVWFLLNALLALGSGWRN